MSEPAPDPSPTKITIGTLVLSAWRTAPPMLRTFSTWVWTVASIAAAGSVWADFAGYWGRLSFTPNLVSEAISAAFAVPIALLVVSQLAAYQTEEAARPRLEARVRAARTQVASAVEALRDHTEITERDVTGAVNDFVRAARPDARDIEPDQVVDAARMMHSLTDSTEWIMLERYVAPVRLYGTYLHNALVDRNRDGVFAQDIVELARLTGELGSAVSHHKRIMDKGQALYGRRLTAVNGNRINELRDMALEYLKSIDRMQELCDDLSRYTSVTP
jgi:hypothetical protein